MAFDSRDSLMSTPMSEFDEPKVLPNGHYFGQIIRHEWNTVGERNTDALDYYCQVTEACDDVDAKEVAGLDLREYEMRARFFVTKRAMYRLRAFHASLGFDENLPADAVLPETTGRRVLMAISSTEVIRQGRKRVYSNVEEIVGAAD